jgi:hypothetical protein
MIGFVMAAGSRQRLAACAAPLPESLNMLHVMDGAGVMWYDHHEVLKPGTMFPIAARRRWTSPACENAQNSERRSSSLASGGLASRHASPACSLRHRERNNHCSGNRLCQSQPGYPRAQYTSSPRNAKGAASASVSALGVCCSSQPKATARGITTPLWSRRVSAPTACCALSFAPTSPSSAYASLRLKQRSRQW